MFKKYIVGAIMALSPLIAVEVPLQKIITTEVAIGEWSVFDFPFKISEATPTSFKSRYSVEAVTQDAEKITGGTDYLDESLPPIRKAPVATNKQGKPVKKQKPIFIKRGSHSLSIYPKKYGETNILIWGHSSYPVTLKIKVVKKKKGAAFLKFKDYAQEQETASTLEKTSHEKAIVVLTKYLYNRKTPKGFTSSSSSRSYKNGKIKMKLKRSILGKKYRGDEWLIKNTYGQTKKLYEEIFYNEGIYSVSLEDNILKPGEATRMFVVRRR